MESKKQKAIKYFEKGADTAGYKIVRNFKLEFTSEEQRIFQIVYESNSDKRKEQFYKSLNIDVDKMRIDAREIIKKKYNI